MSEPPQAGTGSQQNSGAAPLAGPDASAIVVFEPTGIRGEVPLGITLLDAARLVGVEIDASCGGRLECGHCRVRIHEGNISRPRITSHADHVSPPTTEEVDVLKDEGFPEHRLACTAVVKGDLMLTVPPESRGVKQTIRKAVGDVLMDVRPAVRQVYTELEPASLDDPRDDWERLCTVLANEWNMDDLTVGAPALAELSVAAGASSGRSVGLTVTALDNADIIAIRRGFHENAHGLAIDIGTTTIVAHVCDLRTGQVVVTEATTNPQAAYGEDIMSRISFAHSNPAGLGMLQDAVRDALNGLIERAVGRAGLSTDALFEAVIVGNTVMHHLLLGLDPSPLGRAPFAPIIRRGLDLRARDIGLNIHPGARVHLPPVISGHVGSDHVAVMLAEEPQAGFRTAVLDIGTNCEIFVIGGGVRFVASSPMGPAFEGGQIRHGMRAREGAIEHVRIPDPDTVRFALIGDKLWSDECNSVSASPTSHTKARGICGSGIIEAVAELRLAGIVQPDGRFDPNQRSSRLHKDERGGAFTLATPEETVTGRPIQLTQDDIRSVQLAKAAVRAGTEVLMERAGATRLDRILLAGAFGSYLDPAHAVAIGLLPEIDPDDVTAIGNAAGDGARIALLNVEKRRAALAMARDAVYVEIATEASFQDRFLDALHFPDPAHRLDARSGSVHTESDPPVASH